MLSNMLFKDKVICLARICSRQLQHTYTIFVTTFDCLLHSLGTKFLPVIFHPKLKRRRSNYTELCLIEIYHASILLVSINDLQQWLSSVRSSDCISPISPFLELPFLQIILPNILISTSMSFPLMRGYVIY